MAYTSAVPDCGRGSGVARYRHRGILRVEHEGDGELQAVYDATHDAGVVERGGLTAKGEVLILQLVVFHDQCRHV